MKIGSNGSLTLTGSNSYSGATLIRAGTLSVTGTGSLSGSTPYVELGTTLGSPAALVFGPSSATNLTTSGGWLTVSYGSTLTIQPGASFTTAGFVKIASLANNVAGGTVNQLGGTVVITGTDSNNRSLTIGEDGGDTGIYNLPGGSSERSQRHGLHALERQRHTEHHRRRRIVREAGIGGRHQYQRQHAGT